MISKFQVKYTDYVDSGRIKSDIGLEEFARLFLNHRPVIGEQYSELEKVFKIIGKHSEDATPDVSREEFLSFLKTRGETYKEKDLLTFLKPLLDGKVEQSGDDSETFNLQSRISYDWFTKEMLKIKDNLGDATNINVVIDDQTTTIKA